MQLVLLVVSSAMLSMQGAVTVASHEWADIMFVCISFRRYAVVD